MKIEDLLEETIRLNASDLHLSVNIPPQFRIDQQLYPSQYPPLTPDECKDLVFSLLTKEQQEKLEEEKEIDFAFTYGNIARFRGNAFFERGNIACALRRLPIEIPTLKELGLPSVVESLTKKSRGLVLVTGPTGSGKSTTLAAMVDKINSERACHIITIEDPIEYIHSHKKAIVQQREVGKDTLSFARALKYALREDPDVILVGEMRDLETISSALTAAETGHLVLATLHTDSATESINRIIDVFPPHQQRQVRTQLSLVLEGVIVQRLLPKASGHGLVLALEIMIATYAIRSLIRDERVHEIYTVLQTSAEQGMITLNASLFSLAKRGIINWQTAFMFSPHPDELKTMREKELVRYAQKK